MPHTCKVTTEDIDYYCNAVLLEFMIKLLKSLLKNRVSVLFHVCVEKPCLALQALHDSSSFKTSAGPLSTRAHIGCGVDPRRRPPAVLVECDGHPDGHPPAVNLSAAAAEVNHPKNECKSQ